MNTQACGFEMLYQEGRSREEASNIGFDGSSTAVSVLLVRATHRPQRDFTGQSAKGRSATRYRIHQIHKQYSGGWLFSG